MVCKIDGCVKPVKFRGEQLCQMHYFRRLRFGTFDLTRKKARPRILNRNGYVLVHAPGHPLAMKNHYVFEHRKVVYDIYGETLPPCELCGKSSVWGVCHIDHIDRDVENNEPSNLRPLCVRCNTWRDMPPMHTFDKHSAFTFDGKTDTASGWARDPRVSVCGNTIIHRKKEGMSDEEALFAPKVTHNGNVPVKKPRAPLHQRRNAVNICIDGELKTSMEWSRDPRCNVSDATLRNRVRANHEQSLTILLRVKSTDKLKELKGKA